MPHLDFRKLVELAQDGLTITDAEGVFLYANQRFASLTGRSPGQIVGHSYAEFVHPDDVAATAGEVDELAHGMPTFSFRNRWRHVSGEWVRIHWVAFSDPRTGNVYALAHPPRLDDDEEEGDQW